MLRDKRRWLVMAAALALLWPAARMQGQERRSRIDVEHYRIEAEINPRTQTLNAVVSVRFTPVDDNLIDFEIVYDDPKLFTRPIKSVGYLMRAEKGAELMEFACAEGSYALENIFGF